MPLADRANARVPGMALAYRQPDVRLFFHKMTEGAERARSIANDLDDRQHGHRQDRPRGTPHPVPEDQGKDDRNWVYGESAGQQHRRDNPPFYHVDAEVNAHTSALVDDFSAETAGLLAGAVSELCAADVLREPWVILGWFASSAVALLLSFYPLLPSW
jgi:hypothetical protein